MAYISRDPFAREELHRERVYTTKESCAWCGNVKQTRGIFPMTYLYRYRIETDGGRRNEDRHLFCSVDCRRTFYS